MAEKQEEKALAAIVARFAAELEEHVASYRDAADRARFFERIARTRAEGAERAVRALLEFIDAQGLGDDLHRSTGLKTPEFCRGEKRKEVQHQDRQGARSD